jgi:hypothetical protein
MQSTHTVWLTNPIGQPSLVLLPPWLTLISKRLPTQRHQYNMTDSSQILYIYIFCVVFTPQMGLAVGTYLV